MCLSYQNCASRRVSQGDGSQAPHREPAQLILVFRLGFPPRPAHAPAGSGAGFD